MTRLATTVDQRLTTVDRWSGGGLAVVTDMSVLGVCQYEVRVQGICANDLREFELKKILIDKMDKSESYLAAPKHRECYEGLIKSYDLDKTLFSTYDKVYSMKTSRKDKDKDEDPFAGSDRGLKKRKTSKYEKPTKEEPEFEVADSDMPQDQDENLGKDDQEPKGKVASKQDWFTKPKRPQEPTDPDWNEGKTPQ
ncbi:hypothetical protein Tco_0072905 [Tanacetum coccineum]